MFCLDFGGWIVKLLNCRLVFEFLFNLFLARSVKPVASINRKAFWIIIIILFSSNWGCCQKVDLVQTVHFWAPTFKWGISIANVADFSKPPEKLSYPQQIALTCTGIIWSRYSTVITPKNWNLFSVNVVMAGTGLYQLARKIQHDYSSESEAEPAIVKE